MTATTTDDYLAAAAALDIRTDIFIDGRFVPALSGRRFPAVSPRDGSVLAEVAEGDAADIDAAVASARAAFEDGRWARRAPMDRRRTLLRLAALISDHREELALLESLDMGKPVVDALSVDLRVTIESFEYFAEAINKVYDEVAPTPHGTLATITREPAGVVGAVVPWNFPLMMASWKLAPALAAGNSVVLKPAEQSSLTALRVAELASEAGLPDGVLNVVPGFGPTAGAALGRHMDVDVIAFTGSGEVGRHFLRYAADSNMKQVSLECGGKSPHIVFADAPEVATVADAVASGIFYNQGEVCSAGSRLLVHRSRKDELLDALTEAAAQRPPGDPLDPSTQTGALVDARHLERVLAYVEIGTSEGARLVAGGQAARQETGGFYIEPTIFDGVSSSMRIAQEEIFGPVLAVLTFDDDAEAVRLANDTVFGLAAAVWSTNISTALSTARAIRAGTVWVNNYEGSDITVPVGGYGESGFGRDKSLHALDKYTQLKTTWIAF
ncbi:MAG: Betaine-aldehyde dehydrogenase [Conexibacter sp.]|jgi:acyl-CoA reductase-like NAD-dependent aldehyde dehydrogenase|nr:Betaine-aldehyde dehydrogenase [Conexibacter sp.]MCZ4492373.1 Betaine-aldehyde dehydrogenase [Conexibacter sp.]MDX6731255.1 4-guanidinobutyraldehyde dehydrogenase / NAD-dependent aldehyde dehydrogenase [Baekduia sp.]